MEFEPLDILNPFGAPSYFVRETESTMADARILADAGYPSGTVIRADVQTAGRGRIVGRRWDSPIGQSLLCTILLRVPPPVGFTLRVGLAVARAFDAFLPPQSRTNIKWPNDVLSGGDSPASGRKLSGILCESSVSPSSGGSVLFAGTGLNIAQTFFPQDLARKATSLALIPGAHVPSIDNMLETYLACLRETLEGDDWREAVSSRLLYRGERISFLAGDPEKLESIDGTIEGIGESGELLFAPARDAPYRDSDSAFKPDSAGLLHLWSGEIPYPAES